MLTTQDIDALLDRYEAMADAARANDWDRLAALEREAAALRVAVIERTGATPAPTDNAVIAEGIRRILVLDGEIRTHTDPFLAAVRKLLSGGTRDRAVRNAYGALEP